MTSSGLDHTPFCRRHQFVGVWGLCVAMLLVISDAIMMRASRMTKQSKTLTLYYRYVALMKPIIGVTYCYRKLMNSDSCWDASHHPLLIISYNSTPHCVLIVTHHQPSIFMGIFPPFFFCESFNLLFITPYLSCFGHSSLYIVIYIYLLKKKT